MEGPDEIIFFSKGFDDFMERTVTGDFDWVTALLVYQHFYNTTLHTSLGELRLNYFRTTL